MNVHDCVATQLAELFEAIRVFGRNKAQIPWAMDFHDGRFWVYVDIDTSLATWEVEVSDNSLEVALNNAIARTKREARLCGAAA